MKINPNIFVHESDRTALQALKAIPGFTAFLKAYMKIWNERQYRLVNISSNLHVTENQLKKYYDMLPPICEKLGIDVPDLYIDLNVNANSYTSGDDRPFIVMTSGLIETLPEELIPTVLAHECGHIACHHVLYTTMGRMILNGITNMSGFSSLVTVPLQVAFAYWMRCSEYSADRAAVICDGTPEKMMQVCMYLAGFDKDIPAEPNLNAFLEQGYEYREIVDSSKWDKTLEFILFNQYDHPLSAVRAVECKEWAESEQYAKTVRYLAGDQSALDGVELDVREIPLEESSKFYVGKNYSDVQDMLIDAGFSDVSTVKTHDKSLRTKIDQIVKIQINDDNSFDKGDWYPEDASIVITYYEPETVEELAASHEGKIQIPDGSRKYIGRNYQDVINELGDAGFTEFITEEQTVKKGKSSKNDLIVKIAVGGQTQFSKGDWFAPDTRIRITYQIVEN